MRLKKVTMQDIADRLGLTKVSVSKALNGQPGLAKATRERILETAAQMGYRMPARSAPPRRFAALVPRRFFLKTEGFYTEIFHELSDLCLRDGHQIYSVVLSAEEEDAPCLPDALQEGQFDGVFLLGELSERYCRMLAERSLCCVSVDFYSPVLRTDAILSDNFFLGCSATQYLIDRGHTRIGFVGSIFHGNSVMDRYFGYLKALRLSHIEPREDWRLINNDEENLYLLDVMLPQELPTAFVCHCDMAAHYLIESLRREGIRVPQDVSLISFDNTALSQRTLPPLTSFDINRRAIAESAYQCLNERCHQRQRPGRRLIVDNALMERSSVAPPRSDSTLS